MFMMTLTIRGRKLSPSMAFFSRMFLDEVLSIFPYMFMIVVDVFETMMAVGILSLFIGGPALMIFFWSVFTAFGFVMPILFAMPIFALLVYYMISLPSTIIQYDPTFQEFCSVYFPCLVVLGLMAGACIRTIVPRDPLVARIRQERKQD
eukprot:Rmarinus@m.23873